MARSDSKIASSFTLKDFITSRESAKKLLKQSSAIACRRQRPVHALPTSVSLDHPLDCSVVNPGTGFSIGAKPGSEGYLANREKGSQILDDHDPDHYRVRLRGLEEASSTIFTWPELRCLYAVAQDSVNQAKPYGSSRTNNPLRDPLHWDHPSKTRRFSRETWTTDRCLSEDENPGYLAPGRTPDHREACSETQGIWPCA